MTERQARTQECPESPWPDVGHPHASGIYQTGDAYLAIVLHVRMTANNGIGIDAPQYRAHFGEGRVLGDDLEIVCRDRVAEKGSPNPLHLVELDRGLEGRQEVALTLIDL